MPPAVAQAPMVMRNLEARRIWWIVGGGDGAFHQRQVVRPLDYGPRSFREIRNLDLFGDREQFVFAVQEA